MARNLGTEINQQIASMARSTTNGAVIQSRAKLLNTAFGIGQTIFGDSVTWESGPGNFKAQVVQSNGKLLSSIVPTWFSASAILGVLNPANIGSIPFSRTSGPFLASLFDRLSVTQIAATVANRIPLIRIAQADRQDTRITSFTFSGTERRSWSRPWQMLDSDYYSFTGRVVGNQVQIQMNRK